MQKLEHVIKWSRNRRFGVELELNRDPVNSRERSAELIRESLKEQKIDYQTAQVREWEHTYGNDGIWVCKPDSSCGNEICTPPLRGPNELKILGNVVAKLRDAGLKYDETCGLHVHVSLNDFSEEQMYTMLMFWVKIEHNIMNAHPEHRRKNERYCPSALSKILDWVSGQKYSGVELYKQLRRHRGAINAGYWESRKTIEWRMGEMTLDPESIKNRIRFLIWFIEICKYHPAPENLNLYTPKQMMRFLGLLEDESGFVDKKFSPAIQSMRNWILDRLEAYMPQEAPTEELKSVYQRDKCMVVDLKKKCIQTKEVE